MSDKRYAQGNIGGVELESSGGDKLKALIVDGANLQPRRFVNQRTAADGTIFTQGFDTGGRGARFGVKFPFLPVELLHSIIEAVNAGVDSGAGFTVALEDDIQSVDATCTVDGSAWLKYPDQMTNSITVKDVEFRFITIAANES